MSITEIDEFLDWLEDNKDLNREDMRTTLMYAFNGPQLHQVGHFRSDRERYLRRDIADKFLRGEEVDMKDLREAVYYFCVALSEAGDAVNSARKRLHKNDRFPHKAHVPSRTRRLRG